MIQVLESGGICSLLGTALHNLTALGTCGPLDSTWPRSETGRLLPRAGGKTGSERLRYLPRAAKARLKAWALQIQLVVDPNLAPTPHLSTKTFCRGGWCSGASWQPSEAGGCRSGARHSRRY